MKCFLVGKIILAEPSVGEIVYRVLGFEMGIVLGDVAEVWYGRFVLSFISGQVEIHEMRERKNLHMNELTENHNEAFEQIKGW